MSARDRYEFLPAALEVEETPPNTAGRWILWAIMFLVAFAIAWASLSEVEIIATAQGKIVAGGRDKVVQPLESGVVRAIHVRDGQHVHAGEVLIELDPTTNGADVERLRHDAQTAKLEARRLRALSELDALTPDAITTLEVKGDPTDDPALVKLQNDLLQKQASEYAARLAALDADLEQRRADLAATQNSVDKLTATLPLVTQRVQALKALVDQNLGPRQDYLQLEQTRVEQEHDLATQKNRLIQTRAAIRGAQQQKTVLFAEMHRTAQTDLADAQKRAAEFEQDLIKAQHNVALQKLTAPVSGVVQQLEVHTVGGVVTPAQALLVIVPEDQQIEAEALVLNQDIGFVEDGQDAIIKIDTFPFTKYGTIDGQLLHVSNDAIEDKQKGLVYTAHVALKQSTMHINDKVVNLSPGMNVTVDVNTGKRRLIEYFLSPILRATSESVRER